MPRPQSAIIPEPSQHALFLILRVHDPEKNGPAVAKILTEVPALIETLGATGRDAALVGSVGFGSGFWDVSPPPPHARRACGRSPPLTRAGKPRRVRAGTCSCILFPNAKT